MSIAKTTPGSLLGTVQTVNNVSSAKAGNTFPSNVLTTGSAAWGKLQAEAAGTVASVLAPLGALGHSVKEALPSTWDVKFILVAGAIVLVLVLVIVKQFV